MLSEYVDPSVLSARARGLASRLNRFANAMDGETILKPEDLPGDALTIECLAMGYAIDSAYSLAMNYMQSTDS